MRLKVVLLLSVLLRIERSAQEINDVLEVSTSSVVERRMFEGYTHPSPEDKITEFGGINKFISA